MEGIEVVAVLLELFDHHSMSELLEPGTEIEAGRLASETYPHVPLEAAPRLLFVSRVDTKPSIQPAETGRRVESETQRSNESDQAGLTASVSERAYRYDGQHDSE